MTAGRRKALLAQAQELAGQRATHFRLQRRTGKGEPLTGFKLLAVTGERNRTNLLAKGARPQLSTSQWDAIYREVGLR